MAYDSRCLDLAQYFLGCEGDDGDDQQASLAQTIQDAVEDWFATATNASRPVEAEPLADPAGAIKAAYFEGFAAASGVGERIAHQYAENNWPYSQAEADASALLASPDDRAVEALKVAVWHFQNAKPTIQRMPQTPSRDEALRCFDRAELALFTAPSGQAPLAEVVNDAVQQIDSHLSASEHYAGFVKRISRSELIAWRSALLAPPASAEHRDQKTGRAAQATPEGVPCGCVSSQDEVTATPASGAVEALEPSHWHCKDYADGWISFDTEAEALEYQRETGCLLRIVYRPTHRPRLGKFGHHPDPAIDFEIEVQSLEARLFDAKGGISKPGTPPEKVETVLRDIERAMTFPGAEDRLADALAAGREKLAAFMIANSVPTGHGDTIDDLLTELGGWIAERRSEIAGLKAERDRHLRAAASHFAQSCILAERALTAEERNTLHGPYGWLIMPEGLSEEHWRLSDVPEPGTPSEPLFAQHELVLGGDHG